MKKYLKETFWATVSLALAVGAFFLCRRLEIATGLLDKITSGWSNILIALVIVAFIPIFIIKAIDGNKNSKHFGNKADEMLFAEAQKTNSEIKSKAYGMILETSELNAKSAPCYFAVSDSALIIVVFSDTLVYRATLSFPFNEMTECKIRNSSVPKQYIVTAKTQKTSILIRASEFVGGMPEQEENLKRTLSELNRRIEMRADIN